MRKILGVLCVALGVISCGDDDPAKPEPGLSINGTWAASAAGVNYWMTLSQQGASVTGNGTFANQITGISGGYQVTGAFNVSTGDLSARFVDNGGFRYIFQGQQNRSQTQIPGTMCLEGTPNCVSLQFLRQ